MNLHYNFHYMFGILIVFQWFFFSFCSELLFTSANFNITRSVMRTLGCGDQVHHNVVYLFVYLLNHLEKLKDPQSALSRFYFSCNACVSYFCNYCFC